jgi:hypothetical protein
VSVSQYVVRSIPKEDTHDLLLNVHYAKRLPSISYAFGLFRDERLVGVITYGQPASPTLCKGVAGEANRGNVIELNRLCLVDNLPNEASRLVGASLKLLPGGIFVVSYADSAQSHLGVVYQATNFLFTGTTASRKEWAVRGLEHMHSKAISNTVADSDKPRMEALKEKYGDRVYYRQRSRKHRYVFLVGNKAQRKEMREALRYEVLPYPKEEVSET